MRIRVFGAVTITLDSAGERLKLGPRPRLLVARLVADSGRVVDDDLLVDAIWGAVPPPSTKTALQGYVSAVRDALEPGRRRGDEGTFLRRVGTGYRLDVTASQLDYREFDDLTASIDRLDERQLDRLIELSSEPLLSEYTGVDWADARRVVVAEARAEALVQRFESELSISTGVSMLPLMRSALEEFAFHERLTALAMTAFYRSGQQRTALEVFRTLRARLVDELGIAPGPDIERLYVDILNHQPTIGAPDTRSESLTPLALDSRPSGLIGRSSDITTIIDGLLRDRTVTVLGPGGVGKTSVIREAVAELENKFDFPRWCDVADASSHSLDHRLMELLGVAPHPMRPLGDVVGAVARDSPTLIVLDTCDIAIETVRPVVEALLSAPDIYVLIASRRPVGHADERRYNLDALGIDNAIAVLQRSILNPSSSDTAGLRRLAERVDRLPLGLMMASSKLDALGPDAVLADIDAGKLELDQPAGSAPPRHHSLDAVVSWSLDALDDSERRLLQQCCAFSSPVPFEAIVTVTGGSESDRRAQLSVLVDASLIERSGDAPARFRVLETVASVARQRDPDLVAEAQLALAHHVAARAWADYTGTGESIIDSWETTELLPAFGQLESSNPMLATMLAIGAARTWLDRGSMERGRQVLERALAQPAGVPSPLRSIAQAVLGFTQLYQGDMRGALRSYQAAGVDASTVPAEGFVELVGSSAAWLDGDFDESWKIAQQALDSVAAPTRRTPANVVGFGKSAVFAGDLEGAARCFDAARDLAIEWNDPIAEGNARRQGAVVRALRGDHDGAWRWIMQALALHDEQDSPLGAAQSAASMALVAALSGDRDTARSWAATAIDRARRQFDVQTVSIVLPVIAWLDVGDGRPERAAQLLGWLDSFIEDQRHVRHPTVESLWGETVTRLAEADPLTLRRWSSAGSALTASALLELALD